VADDAVRGLSELSADERMFQDSVRQFAADRIAPLARLMDETQQMDAELVREMFALGWMGIETPEEFGGAGGSFFDAILAVEAISAVDPAVGVLVDVQNTLCANALLRWASAEQRRRYLPRLAADTVGAYALSEAASGSDAFALETRAVRRGSDYVLNGRKRPGYSSCLRPSIRQPGTRASRLSWWRRAWRASRSGARKTSWEYARRAPASCCFGIAPLGPTRCLASPAKATGLRLRR